MNLYDGCPWIKCHNESCDVLQLNISLVLLYFCAIGSTLSTYLLSLLRILWLFHEISWHTSIPMSLSSLWGIKSELGSFQLVALSFGFYNTEHLLSYLVLQVIWPIVWRWWLHKWRIMTLNVEMICIIHNFLLPYEKGVGKHIWYILCQCTRSERGGL